MLGSVCFRLCARGSNSLTTVALSHFHHPSPHSQVLCRHVTALSRNLSWPCQQVATLNTEGCTSQSSSFVKRSCCHTSSCLVEGNEVSCATIWHGLLPSHHPSILDQNIISPFNSSCSSFSSFDPCLGSTSRHSLISHCKNDGMINPAVSAVSAWPVSSVPLKCTSGSSFPHGTVGGMGRFAMAAGLLDGSWNVAWDARPARWLHGRNSAWLLFGVCSCFSAAAGASIQNMLPSPLLHTEPDTEHLISAQGISECGAMAKMATVEKEVCTDYSVTGVPGDGRCLFRAVAHGACVRSGKPVPTERLQRELADDLRGKVVDELVMRRAESEWFIEGDFDTYVMRMREPYVWGGEPELLMACHVLKMPITVHFFDGGLGGLITIAEYGLEYGSENPIRVLYHGFGHYDAIQVPGVGRHAVVGETLMK